MVLAPVMLLAYVLVDEEADMVGNQEADIVVDKVADMEVDKVAKDMVADMVATTVFERGYAQSCWVAVAAMYMTLSNCN